MIRKNTINKLSKISKVFLPSLELLAANRIIMKQNWKVIAAFSVIYFIWGTTYLAILFAIKDIPPF
jgi:hypothetical protein